MLASPLTLPGFRGFHDRILTAPCCALVFGHRSFQRIEHETCDQFRIKIRTLCRHSVP